MATTIPTRPDRPLADETAARAFRRLTDVAGRQPRAPLREQLLSLGELSVPALASGLGDDDPYVRFEAINLLGELAIPRTLPLVLGFALDEYDTQARWRAFWAVTRLPRDLTVPRLLDAITNGIWQVRWHAALMLGMMGRDEAAPVIAEALGAADQVTRWEALGAARALALSQLAEPVTTFLDMTHPVHIRQEAALALGRMEGPIALVGLGRALDDPVAGVRWRAAIGLGRFGDHAARLLQSRRAKEQDPRVSRRIDQTLRALQGL